MCSSQLGTTPTRSRILNPFDGTFLIGPLIVSLAIKPRFPLDYQRLRPRLVNVSAIFPVSTFPSSRATRNARKRSTRYGDCYLAVATSPPMLLSLLTRRPCTRTFFNCVPCQQPARGEISWWRSS